MAAAGSEARTAMAAAGSDTVRAVAAYFSEVADTAAASGAANYDPRVSLGQFANFLQHYRILNFGFDHSHVLAAYLRGVEVTRGPTSDGGAPAAAPPASGGGGGLDVQGFRAALAAVAGGLLRRGLGASPGAAGGSPRGDDGGDPTPPAAPPAALEELLQSITLRRQAPLEPLEPQHEAFYDEAVVRAVYGYGGALQDLFLRYSTAAAPVSAFAVGARRPSSQTSNGGTPRGGTPRSRPREEEELRINCRSLYRVSRAVGLIPQAVVSGEFVDLLSRRHLRERRDAGATATSASQLSGSERNAERRYFEEERMCAGGEQQDWSTPARGTVPGEPRYTFPEFVELLTQMAFSLPPRPLREPAAVRARRVQEVFGNTLGPALNGAADEGAKDPGGPRSGPAGPRAKASWPRDVREMLVALAQELPPLPSAPRPGLPEPPADKIEDLRPQPATVEERIERATEKRLADATAAATPLKRRLQKKGRDRDEAGGPILWEQATFYAKKPSAVEFEIPPQWLQESRHEQLERLQSRLRRKQEEAAALAGPATGWVLRMTLIDEPLRAPPCEASEEVSTLMETAITCRRLRQYDAAVALLIRARRVWGALAPGPDVPPDWADVQPVAAVHSPWETRRDETMPTGTVGAGLPKLPIHPSGLRGERAERAEGLGEAPATQPQSPTTGSGSEDEQPRRNSQRDQYGGKPSWKTQALTKRYDPKTDFALALGTGDQHLARLPPEVELFFFFELASLHSVVHEEDLAAQLLWKAREYSDKLPSNHPDTAVVWCGFSRLAFRAGAFDVAARSAARAREVRERTLGGDVVETATTYGNLACCLEALDRPLEAMAFAELAAEILRELLGEDHPRTMTALRNAGKARAAKKHIACEVPYLFSFPVRVHGLAKRKVVGKRKKKKGGTGSDSSRASSVESGRGRREL